MIPKMSSEKTLTNRFVEEKPGRLVCRSSSKLIRSSRVSYSPKFDANVYAGVDSSRSICVKTEIKSLLPDCVLVWAKISAWTSRCMEYFAVMSVSTGKNDTFHGEVPSPVHWYLTVLPFY